MKASIPEFGTVIRLEDGNAIVFIKGDKSCKGCGAGQMGLCKPGGTMTLNVRNTANARVGDTVRVGFEQDIQTKGYLLVYVLPLFALIAGAFGGHIIGSYVGIPFLDVIIPFIALALSLYYSFERLKKLDSSSRLIVEKIISLDIPKEESLSEEERRYLGYNGYFII